MSIGWRCGAFEIENFRGIQKLQLELPSKAPAVLIGANNAGKSSILDALSMCLGGPAFYNYSLSPYDFFHDAKGTSTDSFRLNLCFSTSADLEFPAVRGAIGNPTSVAGVRVNGSRHHKTGILNHDVRLFDANNGDILLPSAVPLQGKAKEEWSEHKLNFKRRYARWSDLSDHRPEVWHLKPSNLYVSLYQWKTGPLQKLASLMAKEFFQNKWEFKYSDKQHPMPQTLAKVHEFFGSAVRSFPFWQEDLKPKLQETLSLYVGRQARIELKPDISSIEEWLTQQLALSFASDAGGAATPLEKMGDGWQSLVRIAALDVLSQYPAEIRGQVVLLFEEPESFLHPHLARKLRGVLERLADGGWTVVITTHSPNLVSFSGKQYITRLTRVAEAVELHTLRVEEIATAPKFQERLDERGAHEMLFARKAVLCEGQDDVFAIRSYLLERSGLDLDGKSISIIRTGDVGQLAGFAAMANKLGIPWCAISDEDRLPDGTIKPATAKARAPLEPIKTAVDLQINWAIDLETCLKVTNGKATPKWQADNLNVLSSDITNQYPDYVGVCEQVKRWIEN